MKTLQEQYNLIKEGKGNKNIFLTKPIKELQIILIELLTQQPPSIS